MSKLTKKQAALLASAVSAKRTLQEMSKASKKAAKTRLYDIKQALVLGCTGPMSFSDAGRKGAAVRWGLA